MSVARGIGELGLGALVLQGSVIVHEACHAGVGVLFGGNLKSVEVGLMYGKTAVNGLEAPERLATILAPHLVLGPMGIAAAYDGLKNLAPNEQKFRNLMKIGIGATLVPIGKAIDYVATHPIRGPYHDFMFAAHKFSEILYERFPRMTEAVNQGPEEITTVVVGAVLTGVAAGIYKTGEYVLKGVDTIRRRE